MQVKERDAHAACMAVHACGGRGGEAAGIATVKGFVTHPMLGQRASSQTVCRLSSRSLPLISVYLSPPGTARFSQSGFRAFSCRGQAEDAQSQCRARQVQ